MLLGLVDSAPYRYDFDHADVVNGYLLHESFCDTNTCKVKLILVIKDW